MESQRSRSFGSGGLWLHRIALQPIDLRSSSRRSQIAIGTAAPTAPPS